MTSPSYRDPGSSDPRGPVGPYAGPYAGYAPGPPRRSPSWPIPTQGGYPGPGLHPSGFGGFSPPPPPQPPGTNGLAVATLVLGIFGFLLLPIPIALILGIVALTATGQRGRSGRGMAIAGILLAVVWTGLFAVVAAGGYVRTTVTPVASTPTTAPPTTSAAPTSSPTTPRPTSTADNPTSVNVVDLAVGDCVDKSTSGATGVRLSITSCTSTHDGEVFAVFPVPGTTFPGRTEVVRQAENGCSDAELRRFAPAAARDPNIAVSFTYPTAESWAAGSRDVSCIAVSTPPATGSIRGR